MTIDELRWLVGLDIVLAIWLGMLADSWKGRNMYAWIAIGLFTSVFGIALLLFVSKLKTTPRPAKINSRFSPTDSYGH